MKLSHYYCSAAKVTVEGRDADKWQGIIRVATERETQDCTTHVLHRKVYKTLPRYSSEKNAEDAGHRLARQMWGTDVPFAGDKGVDPDKLRGKGVV